MSVRDRFGRLGTDNAPGQEVRQQAGGLEGLLRGGPLEGRPVDFSHGDVDAHEPAPGAFDLFSAGVAAGGAQAIPNTAATSASANCWRRGWPPSPARRSMRGTG